MIIPTDGGLRPADAKWQPMIDWLAANLFDLDWVPTDAWIAIRDGADRGFDGQCLGVEMYSRDNGGRLILRPDADRPLTRVEWHPMVQSPPSILLPEQASR